MRINKYIAQEFGCSRREADKWIEKGWVTVNGNPPEPGQQVESDSDTVAVTDLAKSTQTNAIVIAFHKPRGIVTNCPQEDEKEITDLLPKKYKHLNSIGRLDKDSEGLILLTDSGAVARHYLNADIPHERVYEVTVGRPIMPDQLRALEDGLPILGQMTLPLTVEKLSPKQILMTMREGKNRQIRRMLLKLGLRVTRLVRLQFDQTTLDGLAAGEYRDEHNIPPRH
ncbi:rRNA pseudouridine synthase [bacterium]|jgi:23S rRNA pseudouridine2604 synthase|nr:rRNA pseudouridine synthase [bacterium]